MKLHLKNISQLNTSQEQTVTQNTPPSNKIAVCILAAGASSRMGEPKQLLKWGNRSLLGHAIAQAQQVSKDVFVVLGAHYKVIVQTITGANIVFNKDWELGMGSSIAAGVRNIRHQKDYNHILVMLADQPYLNAHYLREMMDIANKKPNAIIATQYKTKAGVPAIFSAKLFGELELLNQDYGARKLMQDNKEAVIVVSPNASTMDIDTKDIYLREKPNTI